MKKLLSEISLFFILIITAYIVKVPIAYSTFYAEDGVLFFQEAHFLQFPLDFIEPATGYLILVSRIIGRVVSLFPLEVLPMINFTIVCLFLSIICVATWRNLSNLIGSLHLKLVCCLSILFLPITNFEHLATSSILHFILLFPTALIFLRVRSNELINRLDIIIVTLCILSDPTSVMLLLLLIKIESLKNRRTVLKRIKLFYPFILSCFAIQSIYVLESLSSGTRSFQNLSSIPKTVYLYLDRVIGSALVPNWGFVSSADFSDGIVTVRILSRAAIVSVILCIMIYFIFRSLQQERPENFLQLSNPINKAINLVMVSFIYWMTLGFFFNPEPRYAIFPGLCLVTFVLIFVDRLSTPHTTKLFFSSNIRRYLSISTTSLFILTWVFSFNPSMQRIDGPTWKSELKLARELCEGGRRELVSLRIIPKDWSVELKCTKLNNG